MKKNTRSHKNAEPSTITLERDSAGMVALTLLSARVFCKLHMTPAQAREMAATLLTFAPACEAKQRAREARGE